MSETKDDKTLLGEADCAEKEPKDDMATCCSIYNVLFLF